MKLCKKFFVILLSLLLMCVPALAKESTSSSNLLKISYINVGQGDSTLIQVSDKNILIDAGNNDNRAYNYLKDLGVTKLDYVIATHPHADHIGNMKTIIDNMEVCNFYAPQVNSNTQTYSSMISALKNKSINIIKPIPGEQLQIGAAILTFIAPNSKSYEDLNNYSIVVKLKFGNTSFIFQGDAEDISEAEILEKQLDISADVIKIGHHGSYSSSSEKYLNRVSPKYAVISVGTNNDFGHPHKNTLDKLLERNIKTYRTDVNGTITAYSDGINITFNSEKTINTTSNNIDNTLIVANKVQDKSVKFTSILENAKKTYQNAKETVKEAKKKVTESIINKISK